MLQRQYQVEKLYQVPQCSIFLQFFSDNLCNLQCGHVFHYGIERNVQYRPRCPNCLEEALLKQIIFYKLKKRIHKVLYSLEENKNIENIIRNLEKFIRNSKQQLRIYNKKSLQQKWTDKYQCSVKLFKKQIYDLQQQLRLYKQKTEIQIKIVKKRNERLKRQVKFISSQEQQEYHQEQKKKLRKIIKIQQEQNIQLNNYIQQLENQIQEQKNINELQIRQSFQDFSYNQFKRNSSLYYNYLEDNKLFKNIFNQFFINLLLKDNSNYIQKIDRTRACTNLSKNRILNVDRSKQFSERNYSNDRNPSNLSYRQRQRQQTSLQRQVQNPNNQHLQQRKRIRKVQNIKNYKQNSNELANQQTTKFFSGHSLGISQN